MISYSAARRNEHDYHIVFCLAANLFGCVLMLTLFDKGKVAIYFSAAVPFCGLFCVFPLLLSWLTNNVGGHTKRIVAISLVIGIGEFSGIFTSLIRDLKRG